MLLSYSISGRLLLNLCIMSHRGKHLSFVYDKIPVFYALKYLKFLTITFYPPAWRPNPLLTLPNCTTPSWLHAHFNDIFTRVTISVTNMKVSRVKQPTWHGFRVKICWYDLLYVTPLSFFVIRKCQKIRNIDGKSQYWRRKSSYHLKTWGILMTFSEKMWLMIISKFKKKRASSCL